MMEVVKAAPVKKSPVQKILSIVAIIILSPAIIGVLLIVLAFILGLAPFLVLAFGIYSYYGFRAECEENKLKLEHKLKTNKDYLTYEYKKFKIHDTNLN